MGNSTDSDAASRLREVALAIESFCRAPVAPMGTRKLREGDAGEEGSSCCEPSGKPGIGVRRLVDPCGLHVGMEAPCAAENVRGSSLASELKRRPSEDLDGARGVEPG